MAGKGEDAIPGRGKKRDGSPIQNVRTFPPGGGIDCSTTPPVAADLSTAAAADLSTAAEADLSTAAEAAAARRINEMFSKVLREVSPSVVTVASNYPVHPTAYGTGFVLLSDEIERWSVILASAMQHKKGQAKQIKHTVFFQGGPKYPAKAFLYRKGVEFILLLVTDMSSDHIVAPLTLSTDPPIQNEVVCTIGAMAGTRLNSTSINCDEMVGDLGIYKGFVVAPSCASYDYNGEYIEGTDCNFILRFSFEDDIVRPEDIENERHDEKHTCDAILSAPICRPNKQVVGIICSKGDVPDIKHGSVAKEVLNWINFLCKTEDDGWKACLHKKVAKLAKSAATQTKLSSTPPVRGPSERLRQRTSR